MCWEGSGVQSVCVERVVMGGRGMVFMPHILQVVKNSLAT